MATTKVAINGFGRIGRAFFRLAHRRDEIDIVAINDLGNLENLVYLLKYDSVYGTSDLDVVAQNGKFVVDGKEVTFLSEKDPNKLPWRDLDVDIALESTGVFASYEKSRVHLDVGARRVVVSAPVKDEPPEGIKGVTALIGVNDEELQTCDISSNASCTTNAGSPIIKVLNDSVGIEKAFLNTIHGYTATQSLVDSPNKKDFRRGRAAAVNIIPSSTGAAVATTKAIPELEGLFDGIAVRVPVVTGSLVDITFLAKRETTAEEINSILTKAAGEEQWKEVFAVTEEQLVSSDILGSPFASIVDLAYTRVVGGNLVKVLSWYDNEEGYTHALVEHVIRSGRHIAAQQ